MTDLRLVVFDVDGTLIDSQHVIFAAMTAAFAEVGLPMPARETALSVVGLSLGEAMATLAPGRPEADILRLADLYRQHFRVARIGATVDEPPLYPGAHDALRRLDTRDDLLLGIATGKARAGLDHVLAAHALAGFFVTLQTADLHPSKPHPSMLLAALAETGCIASGAVMVGDTEYDMVMGRAAGFSTIGVTWGYHPRERLIAAGADSVISDFAELDDALHALGFIAA